MPKIRCRASPSERVSGSPSSASQARRIDAARTPLARLLDDVAAIVLAGGAVVFPTDFGYALGCDPQRTEAVTRVLGATRAAELQLYVASPLEALEYSAAHVRAFAMVRDLLPGPVTLRIRRPPFVHPALTGDGDVLGLRVPDHPLCAALVERCGPLAAAPARPGRRGTWDGADAFVDNGPRRASGEATVLDLTSGAPRLEREGVLTMGMLEVMIGRIDPPPHGPA